MNTVIDVFLGNGHIALPDGDRLAIKNTTAYQDIQKQFISEFVNAKRSIKAAYDAAQTSYGNEAHWAAADSLGPVNAARASVRKTLRKRSRYEIGENNPYLKGMILKIANSFAGVGPSLYITDPRIPISLRPLIINKWMLYARAIKLRQLIWRLRGPRSIDGEATGINLQNNSVKHEIQTDWEVIETEQIAEDNYFHKPHNPSEEYIEIDGIRLRKGTSIPESYYVLNQHPGDNVVFGMPLDGEWVPADNVIHWFRKDRPWIRGIPEGHAVLPLCSILRRYTLAVVQCAETAANISVLLESEAPAGQTAFGSISTVQNMTPSEIMQMWFDAFPMYRGMAMNLPWGMKASQLKAEQPTAVYDSFVDAILREIAQPFLVPFNAAVGFSGDYNMASGTLDVQMLNDAITADHLLFQEDVLDPKIFTQWWFEAVRIPGYFENPQIENLLRNSPSLKLYGVQHEWGWEQRSAHPDPLKLANTRKTDWDAGFLTDEDIQNKYFHRSISDWEAAIQRQNAFREENGLPLPGQNGKTEQEGDTHDDGTEDRTPDS